MSESVAAGHEAIVIGLYPGDLLLESINEAIEHHNVQSGVVVSGIGTLKKCCMHYVNHSDFPSEDRFFELTKPMELLSISGTIADGKPHLHVVVSCREDKVWGGHLENGSEILYLGEVVLLKFSAPLLTRRPDKFGIMHVGGA